MARALVSGVLTARLRPSNPEQRSDIGNAMWLTGELVTVAVHSGRDDLTVGLHLHRAEVRLTVVEGDAGWAERKPLCERQATGRGLNLVHLLTARWGVLPRAGGRTMWATLDVSPGLTASVPCDLVHPAHASAAVR